MPHNTVVGKDILEMLMFSLYPEAETIYREYLQNACDSINEAVEIGLLDKSEDGHVYINIDKFHQKVTITDKGTGISANEAEARLKDIAAGYKKHKESAAGFYGIGRLVGAGYCKKLSFKTSAYGENVASEIVFDVERIREILNDDENNFSASEVIDAVTTFNNTIPESEEEHYFVVTMTDILPEYPKLLDEELIRKYLVQVAPIPFLPEFKNNLIIPNITGDNEKYQRYYKQLNSIHVSLNDNVDIKKQYSLTVDGAGDEIDKLRFFSLNDPQYGDLAWGWYAITPFEKAIPDTDPCTNMPVLTRGIRLRVHNIQIGNENFFDGTAYFRQARSNKYFNGEIHVINPKIKPTTDRSDLAPSKEALKLKELIADFFNSELQKVYQTANKVKKELERIIEAETSRIETEKKNVTNNFSEASKAEWLSEKLKQKTEAEIEFDKYQKKKETVSEGIKAMLDVYQKKFEEFKKNVSEGIDTKRKDKVDFMPTPKPTIEEEVTNLIPRYGTDKIEMLKQIFQIIDTRYKNKYEKIIKSIKISVVNDLKK